MMPEINQSREFDANALRKMVADIEGIHGPGRRLAWVVGPEAFDALRATRDSTGRYVFDVLVGRCFGYPVIERADAPPGDIYFMEEPEGEGGE